MERFAFRYVWNGREASGLVFPRKAWEQEEICYNPTEYFLVPTQSMGTRGNEELGNNLIFFQVLLQIQYDGYGETYQRAVPQLSDNAILTCQYPAPE